LAVGSWQLAVGSCCVVAAAYVVCGLWPRAHRGAVRGKPTHISSPKRLVAVKTSTGCAVALWIASPSTCSKRRPETKKRPKPLSRYGIWLSARSQ
jgi:hypothetical protein